MLTFPGTLNNTKYARAFFEKLLLFAVLTSPKLALFAHAAVVAACPLLRDERTKLRRGPRSEFDPKATSDAWKDGGAPRC